MNKTIEISFNPEKIDNYLKSHGSVKIADSHHAKHIFLKTIEDFLKKKIDSEMLSGVANRLYYTERFRYALEFDSKLDEILDHLSELKYHLTIKDDVIVTKHLGEMKEYYEKNRHLLSQKTEGE